MYINELMFAYFLALVVCICIKRAFLLLLLYVNGKEQDVLFFQSEAGIYT